MIQPAQQKNNMGRQRLIAALIAAALAPIPAHAGFVVENDAPIQAVNVGESPAPAPHQLAAIPTAPLAMARTYRVPFYGYRASLGPAGKRVIRGIVANNGNYIAVRIACCTQGNYYLSEQRGQTLRQQLINLGIAPAQIHIETRDLGPVLRGKNHYAQLEVRPAVMAIAQNQAAPGNAREDVIIGVTQKLVNMIQNRRIAPDVGISLMADMLTKSGVPPLPAPKEKPYMVAQLMIEEGQQTRPASSMDLQPLPPPVQAYPAVLPAPLQAAPAVSHAKATVPVAATPARQPAPSVPVSPLPPAMSVRATSPVPVPLANPTLITPAKPPAPAMAPAARPSVPAIAAPAPAAPVVTKPVLAKAIPAAKPKVQFDIKNGDHLSFALMRFAEENNLRLLWRSPGDYALEENVHFEGQDNKEVVRHVMEKFDLTARWIASSHTVIVEMRANRANLVEE